MAGTLTQSGGGTREEMERTRGQWAADPGVVELLSYCRQQIKLDFCHFDIDENQYSTKSAKSQNPCC